jgi:hypothetical protein
MGHRRMLGRTSGNGFRFLHDEISGGLFGYSHLKVKSSYAGPAVRVGTTDFNFAANITPLSSIQSAFPTTQDVIYYDQVNGNDAATKSSIGPWNGTDYVSEILNCSTPSISIDLNAPKTYLVVYDASAINSGICTISNSPSIFESLVFAGTTGIWARKKNGSPQSTRQWNFAASSDRLGLHLLIFTDDGSLDASGWQLYFDDPVTAKTVSVTQPQAVTNATLTSNIGLKNWAVNSVTFTGYLHEFHCWNKQLSLAERTAAKDILRQYSPYLAIP